MRVRLTVPALLALLLLLAGARPGGGSAQQGEDAPIVVILVRHAEKAAEPADDPPLTGLGRDRARALDTLLRDAGVTHLHSTATSRTRQTLDPIARRTGISIEPYRADGLPGLAARLLATPGRHLVSGHSNTTPLLVGLLGGEPGDPIAEADEYDRLYVLTMRPGEETTTLLLRYGAR